MALTPDVDYVFYPKAHVVENRLAKISDACFLGTKRYIFVVPKRSIQSFLVATRITQYNDGQDPAAALRDLLASDALTTDELEQQLVTQLDGDKETRIFPLDQVEVFEMKTGFWGQTKLKLPGDKLKLVNIRGKGNKAAAQQFYADRL